MASVVPRRHAIRLPTRAMRLIKIALANVDTTVGAVRSNTDRALALARQMEHDDVTLGCFPEQMIGGYPAEDLVQWSAFVTGQRKELHRFASATASSATVFVLGLITAVGGQLFNSAAVVHRGTILGLVPKEKLPTYNVFYERRTLSRGASGLTLDADGIPLGDHIFIFDSFVLAVEVCEDAWSPDGPMRRRCYSGAEVVVNISASPYRVGVVATRREMLATRSADNQATLAYANAVGGQDALVFDGGGYVFQNGRLFLDAPRFRQGFATCIVDLDRTVRLRRENTTWRADCEAFQRENPVVPAINAGAATADGTRLTYPPPLSGSFLLSSADCPARSPREVDLDDLFEALALGLKDYSLKSGVSRVIGVALSGGRDSVLSLLIAWRATGLLRADAHENAGLPRITELAAFYMPSRYSGAPTRSAAAQICRDIGIELRTVAIDEAFAREVDATHAMLGDGAPSELTMQNVQARLRASRMWNWANSAGALFLQTSDMSEKAVGYTTLGGDLEGALSVIANVPKTVVVALLERLHERFGFEGIRLSLATTPGPELASEQSAEQELMPFDVLDACLYLYAGEKMSPVEVAAALPSLFPNIERDRLAQHAQRFVSLFTRSIHKWVRTPLTLHVGSLDLDRERALQLPVIQQTEWAGDPLSEDRS
jgi:NAD+ synthase (glutamine-hydrolysing)